MTAVVVVAVSSGGTCAGPIVAAGGAALESALDKEDKHVPPPKQIDAPKEPEAPPIPALVGDKLVFAETGVVIDGRYSSYNNILWNRCELPQLECSPSLFPKFDSGANALQPNWIPTFSETINRNLYDHFDAFDSATSCSWEEPTSVNPTLYLERGAAYFGAGEYDLALEDYKQFTMQSPAPLSIPEFSLGFAKGLPKGMYESGEGLFLFIADFVTQPIQTSSQVVESVKTLIDLVGNDEWGVVAEVLAPEVHQLVTQWNSLPSDQRGELAGYAVGKHGADILIPGAMAKVAAKSVKSAQELAAVCKNFQLVQEVLVLEAATGIGNGVKIGEVVRSGQTMLALGEDLGLTAREMAELKQAGKLESALNASLDKLASQTENQALKMIDRKQLAKAGMTIDREGYTKAGRALAKHGGRPNTAFPQPKGSSEQINAHGQIILEEILSDPQATSLSNRFGGCDIFSTSGRRARFDDQGNLMGFLQPRR